MLLPVHDQNNDQVATKPYVTYVIMALCLLVFTYQAIISSGANDGARIGVVKLANFNQKFGFVPFRYFANEPVYPINGKKEIMKIVAAAELTKELSEEISKVIIKFADVKSTALILKLTPILFCFLHANLWHLFSNLWFFWIFSDNVEERLGRATFVIFYIAVGAISGLGHGYLNPESTTPLIGASGAISGVMGAYMVLFPKNLVTSFFCPIWFYIRKVEIPAFVVLGFYILMNVFQATKTAGSGVSVAFDCHIVGFIAGVALAFAYKLLAPNSTPVASSYNRA
jgi:membrane associated rhomboid family serine protease